MKQAAEKAMAKRTLRTGLFCLWLITFTTIGSISLNANAAPHLHSFSLEKILIESDLPFAGVFRCNKCDKRVTRSITPEDAGLPILDIIGKLDGISKTTKVDVIVHYTSKTQHFISKARLDLQGGSAPYYSKKSFNITFGDSIRKRKVAFDQHKEWGKQSKYCLKANWTDASHARNIVSARICSKIYASNNKVEDILSEAPNHGFTDGFPILLYFEGKFGGIYTLQIPKERWMFGLKKKSHHSEASALFAYDWNPATFFKEDITLAFAEGIRVVFKGNEIPEKELVENFNAFSRFLRNTQGESQIRNDLGNFISVYRAIDFMLCVSLICGYDNRGKNALYVSLDSMRWIPCVYDTDMTWGIYWADGNYTPTGDPYWPIPMDNLLFQKLVDFYKPEIVSRWKELRASGIVSHENVMQMFSDFMNGIPTVAMQADKERWPDALNRNLDHMNQISGFSKARIEYLDGVFAQWQKEIDQKGGRP